MIYTHIAAALLGAAIAATGAWQAQSWRLGGQIATLKAAHAAEQAQAEANARQAEAQFNTRLQKAQNAAVKKETTLRRDVAGARLERDGLRDELRTANAQLADASRTSLIKRAAAAHDVFEQCVREYTGLAEKADRHAIDAGKLYDAWPVAPRRPDAGTTEGNP